MHYRQVDDEFFDVFQETSSRVFGHIADTSFPQTYRCLFTFCTKAGSLKTGMFECVESNNPYAFKILFRSFCEHYLRFMYGGVFSGSQRRRRAARSRVEIRSLFG